VGSPPPAPPPPPFWIFTIEPLALFGGLTLTTEI